MKNMLVSVIIPIYKVEKFIGKCVKTLFEQTLDDVEYIFVDDYSPDNSVKILNNILSEYPNRKRSVKIITHLQNQGLPAARNTGMKYAHGDYIFHCDSDDFLEPDALEKLVISAQNCKADVVWCDWWLSFEHNERYMKQPEYSNSLDALKGLLLGSMKYNVWNKLVRRTLYTDNNIIFPSGYSMGEDMTMIRLMACATKVSYVPCALYHYRKINGEALTNSLFTDRKLADVDHNTRETINFLISKYGNSLKTEISCFKLNVKYPLLISDNLKSLEKWVEWFPESNSYVFQNPLSSMRSKILQKAALHRQYWILIFYYKFVYHFIYGFIYR